MDATVKEKYQGCIMGVMIGDALGAPVEGYDPAEIKEQYPDGVRDYEAAPHMGVEFLGNRRGMYTDDTNATIGLARSLLECRAVAPCHIAPSLVRQWQATPKRGVPRSAEMLFRKYLDPATDADPLFHRKSGRLIFRDGSFANGGAMRISPMGLVCHRLVRGDAPDGDVALFYECVAESLICTHVHPEAIDGAFLLAMGIGSLVDKDAAAFDGDQARAWLEHLANSARTEAVQKNMKLVVAGLSDPNADDAAVTDAFAMGFQIKAAEAVPVALYMFARHAGQAEEAVVRTIALGGDTDTVASMVGALVGALHGMAWLPEGHRWLAGLEDGAFGRSYVLQLSAALADAAATVDYPSHVHGGAADAPDAPKGLAEVVAAVRREIRELEAGTTVPTPLQLKERLPKTYGM